jgi:hypothetical protein
MDYGKVKEFNLLQIGSIRNVCQKPRRFSHEKKLELSRHEICFRVNDKDNPVWITFRKLRTSNQNATSHSRHYVTGNTIKLLSDDVTHILILLNKTGHYISTTCQSACPVHYKRRIQTRELCNGRFRGLHVETRLYGARPAMLSAVSRHHKAVNTELKCAR